MEASIIISVYKNVSALRLILEALRAQTVKTFEVIISEDGENEEIRNLVGQYNWFCSYQHITQPDIGWQKNRALNRAIVAAKNDWLIFIDGDCIPHYRFVEMHLYYAAENRILLGKRVKLSQKVSDYILCGNIKYPQYWWNLLNKGCRYVDEGIFIPLGLNIPLRSTKRLVGCNMSFSKKSIVSINGFDEEFIRPAVGEDVDINWRFRAMGYEFVSVRNRAIVYHLHHKENWIEQEENRAIMYRNQVNNQVYCKKGIDQYVNEK